MSYFDDHSNKSPYRGRATTLNPKSRFDVTGREVIFDGWFDPLDGVPVSRAEVMSERVRSIISYNTSPDLPFDRSINAYRGCEHGCIYCYARPSHNYLDLSSGLDFETKLTAKPNAAEVLIQQLSKPSYRVRPIALGTNTDPYQPIDVTHKITRDILQVLQTTRHPTAIVTKGAMITRDLDILAEMAQDNLVRVGVSVTTLNPKLSRMMEPRAPAPAARLRTIERLSKAGVPTRVMASPLIPALSDHELENILKAGRDHGAQSASWIMLRLPRDVSDLFQAWLFDKFPDRAKRVLGHIREMHDGKLYDANFGHRMRGSGTYAEMIEKRFQLAIKKLGLAHKVPKLNCADFLPPRKKSAQMDLFDG